jgi:hypothetical protein
LHLATTHMGRRNWNAYFMFWKVMCGASQCNASYGKWTICSSHEWSWQRWSTMPLNLSEA